MRSLLCFGDSNTFGTQPMRALGEERRYPFDQRWPGVVQGLAGRDWRVIEEGLPGRTIGRDDPVEGADLNALRYLGACLRSHRPLDALAIMLGTNDLKARFGVPAATIAQGLHTLIDTVVQHQPAGLPLPRLLLISPAPVREVGCLAAMFNGAEARGVGMARAVAEVARVRGASFLDAASLFEVSALDGVHLDTAAQQALGKAVAQWLLGPG